MLFVPHLTIFIHYFMVCRARVLLYCTSSHGLALLYVKPGSCSPFITLLCLDITLLYVFAYADHIHCMFTLISGVFTSVYYVFPWSLVFFTIYSHGSTFESIASHGIKRTYTNLYICVAGQRFSDSNKFVLWLIHYPALPIYLPILPTFLKEKFLEQLLALQILLLPLSYC